MMRVIQSAKLSGRDPYWDFTDVLELPVRVNLVVARFMRRTSSYEGSRSPP